MDGKIQAVIFDVSGTLLHLREPVGETYARFAKVHGVVVPADRLTEAFGRIFAAAPANVYPGEPLWKAEALERQWWSVLVRDTFRAADQMVRFEDFDTFCDSLWSHYAGTEAWELAPAAREMLREIASGSRQVAILSNFDQRLRRLLLAFELHEIFDAITTPADAGAAKPERQIFDVCLKRLGIPGHRAVYVGDHPENDFDGAASAGLHPIDVTLFESLAELPAALDALEKELA